MRPSINLATLTALGIQTIVLAAAFWRQERQFEVAIERGRSESAYLASMLRFTIAHSAADTQVASSPPGARYTAVDAGTRPEDERAFDQAHSIITTAIANTRWSGQDTMNLSRSMRGLSHAQRQALADLFHGAINERRLDVDHAEFFPVF